MLLLAMIGALALTIEGESMNKKRKEKSNYINKKVNIEIGNKRKINKIIWV